VQIESRLTPNAVQAEPGIDRNLCQPKFN